MSIHRTVPTLVAATLFCGAISIGERSAHAQQPAPALPRSDSGTAELAEVAELDTVLVKLQSSSRLVELYATDPARPTQPDRRICAIPCSQQVPRGDTYYATGHQMLASSHFSFPKSGSAFTLKISPYSTNWRPAGRALLYLGPPILALGALLAGIGFSDSGSKLNALSGSGIAMLAIGIGVIVTGGLSLGVVRTRVQIEPAP